MWSILFYSKKNKVFFVFEKGKAECTKTIQTQAHPVSPSKVICFLCSFSNCK